MKLLRRRRADPRPSQPQRTPLDETRAWEQILNSHRSWAPRSVVRARYHDEQRQRQQQRASATAAAAPDARSPVFLETPVVAPPQPRAETGPTSPAPFSRPVPSEPSAQVPAPKTAEDFAIEQFKAFEVLAGNASRLAERIEEARSYEPEDPLPEYLW